MDNALKRGNASAPNEANKKAKLATNQQKLDAFFAPKREHLEDVTNQGSSSEEPGHDSESKEALEDDQQQANYFSSSMYTDELNTMLQTVLDGEQFLFTSSELAHFEACKELDGESKHLFVRLWMRKQRWVRLDKLDYQKHVQDLEKAANQLCRQGFAKQTPLVSELIELLSVDELRQLAKEQQLIQGNGSNKLRSEYIKILSRYRKGDKDWERTLRERVGRCIMLDQDIFQLFSRLQLVYYRVTDTDDKNPMTSAILARVSRRNYPNYVVCRTNQVWRTRQELLDYEEALRLRHTFDEKLELSVAARRRQQDERPILTECWVLCENIIGVWEDLLLQKTKEEEDRPYFLRQFEAGHVYTHLIEHGTQVLAKLHEFELEAIVLKKLLDQRIYRLGKRGKWYDRLALVQMTHLRSKSERERKKEALATCVHAIQDPRVHQIYLNGLHRRIKRLERDLSIPKREQHDFSYLSLRKPNERTIHGERISDITTGIKSIWRGNDGRECTVEEVAIEYYQKQGYRGLHTENGIVSMLFMLLFWDIIFASIPGVFETPYQSAPLDLGSDAFYVGRAGMINERISKIGDGRYVDIIKEVYERESSRQTMCAGVHWDYELEDLLQVAECIGPAALSSLCKLLAEEFGYRMGGMPDLCCWNPEKKECMFVEVKGPGDKLSETQKLWLDTLASLGIAAEVCYVKIWHAEDALLSDTEA